MFKKLRIFIILFLLFIISNYGISQFKIGTIRLRDSSGVLVIQNKISVWDTEWINMYSLDSAIAGDGLGFSLSNGLSVNIGEGLTITDDTLRAEVFVGTFDDIVTIQRVAENPYLLFYSDLSDWSGYIKSHTSVITPPYTWFEFETNASAPENVLHLTYDQMSWNGNPAILDTLTDFTKFRGLTYFEQIETDTLKAINNLFIGTSNLIDTLSGSVKITNGGIYINSNDSGMFGGVLITNEKIKVDGGVYFDDYSTSIDGVTGDLAYIVGNAAPTNYAHKFYGNMTISENLTVDSIFTTRLSDTVMIIGDDQVVTVNASYMFIDSDNATETNRTFTLTNGNNAGQHLTLEFIEGTNKAEIVTGGNALLDAGAKKVFDTIGDKITFIWNGGAWSEEGRIDN